VGHRFGTFVLVAATLFCLLTTWSSGVAPARFADRLGLTIANTSGTNEIRAQYTGFFFAVAAVCLAALAGALSRQAAFVLLAAVFGGLIVGRGVSLLINGGMRDYSPTIVALYAIDSVGLALALAGYAFDRPV
jgi:uncharacterized membrane-anchored protein YitT (DUF2179 family)